VFSKRQGLSLSDVATRSRMNNYVKNAGTNEDQIGSADVS
jgi:hypothetical protein